LIGENAMLRLPNGLRSRLIVVAGTVRAMQLQFAIAMETAIAIAI
jgi:hypothetical protein